MRVSTSTLTSMATSAMRNANNRYADVIGKILSGKKFTKVSENVPDASKVMKLNDQLSKLNDYQSNIQAAINEMNLTYDTLGNVNDEVIRIKDLVLEASNATTTPETAKTIASEISQRVETIMSQMNTKYLDNYIFSGTYTDITPYQRNDEGVIAYNGSPIPAGDRNVTISENKVFTYNFSGDIIFGAETFVESTDPDTEGQMVSQGNFFEQMKELDELLNAETLDYEKIRDKINILDKISSNVIQVQGDTSSKVTKLLSTQEINEETIQNLTESKVNLEETDIYEAASELASAQTALQASYLLGTNILQSVSLLDYL